MSTQIEKIRQQIEFYFDDANIIRDKFLRSTIALSDEGKVSYEILLRFKRLQMLEATPELMQEALVDSKIVSADAAGVRRILPPPAFDPVSRTIYMKTIPAAARDIDFLREHMTACGYTPKHVGLRPLAASLAAEEGSPYKRSCFIELASEEEVTRALTDEAVRALTLPDGSKATIEVVQTKQAWEDERRSRPTLREAEPAPEPFNPEKVVRGLILRLTGLPVVRAEPGATEAIQREDIKMTAAALAGVDVRYVRFTQGDDTADVRFADPADGSAPAAKAAQAFAEAKRVGDHECPELKAEMLEGDEEIAYWEHIMNNARRDSAGNRGFRGGRGGRGGRGRGRGRGGRGGRGRGRY